MSVATMAAQGTASSNLKSSQLAAVSNMLALSSPSPGNNEDASSTNPYAYDRSNSAASSSSTANNSSSPWKILIYDKHTRSIISPLLSVSQLRSRGVTLHLLLHSDREPIPDVPAVYCATHPREPIGHRPRLFPPPVPMRASPLQHADGTSGDGRVRASRREHRRVG
mmetsp:Transcript_45365/g.95191  ORF Transcript_45365/g.95191 Transcript_45365/m.95191 type:complete len:167 (-) Transcript_45365:1673-2173(-)